VRRRAVAFTARLCPEEVAVSKLNAVRPAYVIAGVLLAVSVVVPLLVSTYAKDEPRLWGFPFFYWYQLAWVFVSAITVSISYQLVMREERKRRASSGLDGGSSVKENRR
jgi:Na+/melibiose symporter-like transporter